MDLFSQFFRPSPFPAFESQASLIQAFLGRLEQLGSAMQAGRVSEVARLRLELADCYSQASDAGWFVRDAFKQGGMFPVRRERLIAVEDDTQLVLDAAQELADLLFRRHIDGPVELDESMTRLVRDATEMACLPVELVRRLGRLVQSGMGGSELDSFDVLLRDARSEKTRIQSAKTELEWRLNQSVDGLPSLSVVHLWDVLSALAQLVVRAGRLADHLDLLLVESSEPRELSTGNTGHIAHRITSEPHGRSAERGDSDWTSAVVKNDTEYSTSGW